NNAVTRSDPNGEAMQNLKAEGGDYTRGDALDYGYWGGDGTASVYWGMTVPGIDVTGVSPIDVMRAEFYYSMYNVPLSMAYAVNGINIFGGIAIPQPILKATDARTGLYANGSRPGSANLGALGGPLGQLIGGVADLLGKIWNIPNDIIGLAVGLVSLPFGGHIELGYNAIEFVGSPFVASAITLGNIQIFGQTPSAQPSAPDYPFSYHTVGDEEMHHTYQGQTLGPLYLPANLVAGIISIFSPPHPVFNGYPVDPWHQNNFMEIGPMQGRTW